MPATNRIVSFGVVAVACFSGMMSMSAAAAPGFLTLHTFPTAPYSCNPYGFCGNINTGGASPYAGLLQGGDGNFYGTTETGGTFGGGTVFRLTNNGQFTSLTSFYEGPAPNHVGENPEAALIQGSDAHLYGTTVNGGSYTSGSIYVVDLSNPYIDTLLSFWPGGSPYGDQSYGSVLQVGTSFIATVCYGQNGYGGVVYSNQTVAPMDGATGGACPKAGLIYDTATGKYFGTASSGGAHNLGTVFNYYGPELLNAFSPIHAFAGAPTEGSDPEAPVVLGADGYLYGTTYSGGKYGYGTIFKIAESGGALTTLHSFAYNDGSNVQAGLIQGVDGNFYGATSAGGANGNGTIFKITPTGTFTSLYSFSALYNDANTDGVSPNAVIQATDGNLYGTTRTGGANGTGTIFELIIQKPKLTLTLSPARVTASNPSTLTWSTTSTTTCAASGAWSGSEPTSGSQSVTQALAGTYAYSLTCTGPMGSVKKTVWLTVK